MKIISHLRQDGPFGEYRVELTDEERTNLVDGPTFRAISLAETIESRHGKLVGALAAIPLAIWSDFQ